MSPDYPSMFLSTGSSTGLEAGGGLREELERR